VPASSPWLDQWAPAQHAPFIGDYGPTTVHDDGMNPVSNNTSMDTTLHLKLGATILIALAVIVVLEQMGFRFVSGVNVSAGFGGG
jgi:hypothetical protein